MAKKSSDSGLGAFVLIVIVLGLLFTYWQVALVVGIGALGLGLIWWSRRSAGSSSAVAQSPRTLPRGPGARRGS